MTQEQANTLVINADENILQGWLDLQRVWFDNRNDPDMMKAGIADWQKRYPNNPGAKMLPTQLVNVKAFKPASDQQNRPAVATEWPGSGIWSHYSARL